MSDEIKVTTTKHGYRVYGELLTDVWGATVWVRDSMTVTGPRAWLYVRDHTIYAPREPGTLELCFDAEQVRGLVGRLQAWLDTNAAAEGEPATAASESTETPLLQFAGVFEGREGWQEVESEIRERRAQEGGRDE